MSVPSRRAALSRAIVILASVTAAVSTFLPWLRSGAVDRDLYESAAVAARLGLMDSLPRGLLPAIAPLCAVPALLALMGLRRSMTIVVALLGLCGIGAGGTATYLAMRQHDAAVGLAGAGPVTMLAGGALWIVGAVLAIGAVRWAATTSVAQAAQVAEAAEAPPPAIAAAGSVAVPSRTAPSAGSVTPPPATGIPPAPANLPPATVEE